MPRTIELNLRRQTPGERLFLRRKGWGRSQATEAARLGVCRPYYYGMELGLRDVPEAFLRGVGRSVTDIPSLLLLARRRAGYGLRGTARRLRVSAPTIHAWERSGNADLIKFWRERGFLF